MHIFYVGCSDTVATVTLSHGVSSVVLDVFASSEAFQPAQTREQAGYQVYGTVIPYKLTIDVAMTDAQRTALEAVFASSQAAWGAGNDGSITVAETIRSVVSGRYLLDELQIRQVANQGQWKWTASLTLEKWVGTADTGIANFVIGGNNYCRFSAYEIPAITSVTAERALTGTVLIQGFGYAVPTVWNLGFTLSATERATIRTTYDNSASTYRSGGDGKIAITDGVRGGTANVVMSNYQERPEKLGRWAVSFVLTQV